MTANGQRVVLIVDDDRDLCTVLGELVASSGYVAKLAHDGASAIRLAEELKPDVIVLDIMLNGMDGFEVCKQLKMRRETNLLPIIMLTALSGEENRLRGVRVGANYYLTKPCDPQELLDRIAEAIEWADAMKRQGVKGRISITLESDLTYLDEVNDLLTSLFAHTGLPERQVHKIKYAVLEMGHNAIEWGNRQQQDLAVTIDYTITDEAVTFVVTDEGEGFDPDNLPHASHGDDPIAHMPIREKLGLREGGFGILLSREFMDEVRYNEKGNQVTLVKYLSAAAAETR